MIPVDAGSLQRTEFAAMGTRIEVLAPAGALPHATEMVRILFAEWEQVLSRFRKESELSELNRSLGRAFAASPLLFKVLETALFYAEQTDGTFDPLMLAQIEELGYRQSFELLSTGGPIPSPAAKVVPGGAWRRVTLDRSRSSIALPAGAAVDLGGIAKGMAVDAAIGRLADEGLQRALVSAGGDLRVLGLPPGLDQWAIAVSETDAVIALHHGAVATSGPSRRHWRQGDEERHHLLDPGSGFPARTEISFVTVVAGSCMEADVAAKTAFIRGPEGGARYIEESGLAGLMVMRDGTQLPVGPWPKGREDVR